MLRVFSGWVISPAFKPRRELCPNAAVAAPGKINDATTAKQEIKNKRLRARKNIAKR